MTFIREKADQLVPDFSWALSSALNPYDDKTLRVPMYMTNTYREDQDINIPGVKMSMNPNSVSFRQAKRITEKKTQGGSTFMHWTDSGGHNNDILQLDFRGQTGNINLRRAARLAYDTSGVSYSNFGGAGVNWLNEKLNQFEDAALESDSIAQPEPVGTDRDMSGATKLVKFWDLHRLVTEPVVDRHGNPVFSIIYYSSPLFGNMYMKFIGHFSTGLDFEDVADQPFNKTYSFGFTVEAMEPRLDQIYEQIGFAIGQQFNNNLG